MNKIHKEPAFDNKGVDCSEDLEPNDAGFVAICRIFAVQEEFGT